MIIKNYKNNNGGVDNDDDVDVDGSDVDWWWWWWWKMPSIYPSIYATYLPNGEKAVHLMPYLWQKSTNTCCGR